jgi:hypothetical protein
VDVVAVTPSGQKMKMESFKVKVVVGLASLALPAARNLLAVAADYKYRLWRVGQLTSFAVNVSGGNGPYKASIDWGDGRTSAMPMQSDRLFNMSHTYGKQGGYNIIVRIIDSKNSLSVMQLTAQVKGSVLPVVASSGSSFFGVLFGEIRAWLWLVWPAYIALLLMVISFWIGEKQAYKAILVEKSDQTNRHGKMK